MVRLIHILHTWYVRTAQCKAGRKTALRRSVDALRLRLTPCCAAFIPKWVTGGQKPAKYAGSSCAGAAGAARVALCTHVVVRNTRLPRGRTWARPRASSVLADAKNLHRVDGDLTEKRA